MNYLTLVLVAGFITGPVLLHAQVEPGKQINSPFATYEDAYLTPPGTIALGPYVSFSSMKGSDSLSAPGLDFSLGLNQRFELSGFGAVTYPRDDKDRLFAQADDSYLGVKTLLVSQGSYRPAVAIKPTLEFLGGTTSPHFVLPAILQQDVRFCDLALTAGYITRGVAFGSAKCEWSVGRVTPVAVMQVSRATQDVQAIRNLGLNRTQAIGSAGVGINLTPRWSVFVATARQLGRMDVNSPRFGVSGSIAYTGRLWGKSEEPSRKRIPVYR
jgi:hypothetical protein